MEKNKSFRVRVFSKAIEETFDEPLKKFIQGVIVACLVFFARLFVSGQSSALNYLQDFLTDSVLVCVLFFPVLFFFNLIFRVPYIVGNELQNRLEEIDPDLEKLKLGGHNEFLGKKVGIDIKNVTSDNFVGIIELIQLNPYFVNEHCDEILWESSVPKDSCHFNRPNIMGHDHQVIDIAEIKDGFCSFLTEKENKFMIDMFFIQKQNLVQKTPIPPSTFPRIPYQPIPEKIPTSDYTKVYFELEFEIRGNFKDKAFSSRYECLVTLRANKLHANADDEFVQSVIEIENIEKIRGSKKD